MTDSLHRGARALQDLIRAIADKGDSDLAACEDEVEEGVDTRDYVALAAMVQRSFEANMHHADHAHSEGYLRALTDLLSIVADGAGSGDDWNPIRDTEAAFATPIVVERMRAPPSI